MYIYATFDRIHLKFGYIAETALSISDCGFFAVLFIIKFMLCYN